MSISCDNTSCQEHQQTSQYPIWAHVLDTMSLWQTYRGLSSNAKLGVGVGLLAWGIIGLQFTPKAEEKLGYTPTEADKEALEKMKPKIHTVPRGERP